MAPHAATAKPHSLELGHGLELVCGLGRLDGSVEVAIERHGHRLFHDTFEPGAPPKGFNADLDVVRADGNVELDVFAGELWWSGHLSVRLPGGAWHELLDVDRKVALRFCPGIGEVGGSAEVVEPVVEGFGGSQLCTPAILRIFVDDSEREIAEVGQIVKRRMFADHPPFVFNTVCCVGRVPDGTPGAYPDPTSPWFNVFFGFYQLDCPKDQWRRPFGYRTAARAASEIEAEDVVRLGKSDWNWFSNWLYGVPAEFVEPFSAPNMEGVDVESTPPRRIGSSLWHGLTLRGVEVASCYESDAEGAARLTDNSVIDPVWRNAFGLPNPRPGRPDSFTPTRLVAQVDMSYWEDAEAFHTVIFGGTSPLDADPGFLAAQMTAVREVIERAYPELGFDPA